MLELLHGAHHVQRIAVAGIGVDDQAEIAVTHDAAHLVGELGQRLQHEVGHREFDGRAHRTGENAETEADRFGDARRQRVVDSGGRQATIACQHAAEVLALRRVTHGLSARCIARRPICAVIMPVIGMTLQIASSTFFLLMP